MQTRQLSSSPAVHAAVFDPGDDPIAGLTDLANELGFDGASFAAIGAFERVVVGWFDLDAQDYRRIPVDDQVEVLSLVGDITRAEGPGAKVHAHVVLGRKDGSTVGGHLLEASVRPTLEVVIRETPATLRRRHDQATGLALIALEATAPAGDGSTPIENEAIHTSGGSHGQNRS